MATIEIIDGVTRHPDKRMSEPINLTIERGEQVAIIGNNASGKSRLIDIIIGKFPLLMNEVKFDFSPSTLKLASENIRFISFRDSYGDADGSYYLQQRWNQHDIDPSTPTVGQLLDEAFEAASKAVGFGLNNEQSAQAAADRERMRSLLHDIFHINNFADKYIITLSSGELRKFMLTKALYSAPRLLILESPYIGLDSGARDQLTDLLRKLIADTSLQVILVQTDAEPIPDFITHVIPVKDLKVYPKQSRVVLEFRNVTIQYGARTILKNLNWTVRRGENWALKGENGSGKSTLLSLVCADNPQAYACDISIFNRKRGSGESIWDIKQHIGYVSPEMHRAYMRDIPTIDIVASGLMDTVGLYVRPRPEQRVQCMQWMNRFGISHLADRTFLTLSSGEQRMILVARAFVKNPDLLILDEPLHGLDLEHRELVRSIIRDYCSSPDVTLIMVSHYDDLLPDNITNTLVLKRN